MENSQKIHSFPLTRDSEALRYAKNNMIGKGNAKLMKSLDGLELTKIEGKFVVSQLFESGSSAFRAVARTIEEKT